MTSYWSGNGGLRLVGPGLVQPPHFPIYYEVTSYTQVTLFFTEVLSLFLSPLRNTSLLTSKVPHDPL
jgi:hypothetical protein